MKYPQTCQRLDNTKAGDKSYNLCKNLNFAQRSNVEGFCKFSSLKRVKYPQTCQRLDNTKAGDKSLRRRHNFVV